MGVSLVITIVFSLFAVLPTIVLPTESFVVYLEYAFNILDVVFYVLPAPTVFAIFSIIMTLQVWRILVSLVKTLWDLLPIV